MTYKSPIEIINEKVTEYLENGLMKAVYKADFLVDKEELYKALRYDRDQYARGYADRDHEIVRCKDCRWYAYKYDGYHSECDLFKMCFDPDDYCSRAERKEE